MFIIRFIRMFFALYLFANRRPLFTPVIEMRFIGPVPEMTSKRADEMTQGLA